ncbi:hypothetical protein, partial [Halalkalibacter okhensis]|uniref:hypothetical protein n=1 Tax=Halalkalibacter okhensis TaxID=333138 RepID=UPI001F399CAB
TLFAQNSLSDKNYHITLESSAQHFSKQLTAVSQRQVIIYHIHVLHTTFFKKKIYATMNDAGEGSRTPTS